MLALLLPLAHARMVGEPPEGARTVTILLCTADDCDDRTFWVDHEPTLEHEPVVLVDALLANSVASTAEGERLRAEFNGDLAHAQDAVQRGQWSEADGALDDAARVLDQWKGSPAPVDLFTLWYLRGGVAKSLGYSSADRDFAQAAAVAWNREITLPPSPEAWQPAYFDALAGLLKQPTGTIVLDVGSATTTYTLDGVPLGPAPVRVAVFPGQHRLSAHDTSLDQDWRAAVTVAAGRTTPARARFASGSDPAWAAALLQRAVDEHVMDRELGDLLYAWTTRTGVATVRLLELNPTPTSPVPTGADFPGYAVAEVWFDPTSRRFSSSPL